MILRSLIGVTPVDILSPSQPTQTVLTVPVLCWSTFSRNRPASLAFG